jgi:5'-nucleotidase/UDP-sugar diphosphatase
MSKRLFITVYIIFISLSLYGQDNVKEITILHWNDFHAHNLPQKGSKKDSSGQSFEYYYGGTSNMLGYIEKLRTEKTLVLNAGDDFQGTPISNFTKGKSQIDLLNLYNIDAFVIGNHEFDYGQFALDSALQLSHFDYLSANVFFKPKSSTFGKSWLVKEINGVKIGIIGISPPDLFELSLPKNVSDVVMLNTDSVIQSGIDQLKNEKCNLIVLLTHEGVDNDKVIAEKFFKDVDIIVGGHSHTPLYKPINDKGVIIVQAGSYSKWLGELDLKVDINKDTVVKYYGKLIETVMDSLIYDKAAEEKVEQMEASISKQMEQVIGKLETDWKASHSSESNLGDFEADVFREKTGSDIAFINGGGLRKNLNKGNITLGDIWEINPFGNEINKFSVTGKTLKVMLNNHTFSRLKADEEKKPMDILNCSGLTYSYDSRKYPLDSTNLIVDAKVNGKEVDDNKLYSIATNNFVTGQFKKFFGDVGEKVQIKPSSQVDRDLIIEAVQQKKKINSKLENRIVDIGKVK